MRNELFDLYRLLHTFAAATGADADGIALITSVCNGLGATLATHEQRISELADELSALKDRIAALDGQKNY